MSFDYTRMVIDHSQTKGPDRAIMLALAFRADKNGRAFPSLFRLARDAGLSRRTVYRRLPEIERLGELVVQRRRETERRRHEVSLYRIMLTPTDDGDTQSPPRGERRDTQSPRVGTSGPKGGDTRTLRTVSERSLEPSTTGNALSGRIDYAKAKIPEVEDYPGIHECPDPILVAIAVTEERGKKGWGHWVKFLNRARKIHGREKADSRFKQCVADVFGENKAGECEKPGAVLNLKLKKAFPEVVI